MNQNTDKPSPSIHFDIAPHERPTILAALIYWCRDGSRANARECAVASADGAMTPLDHDEIDLLCRRLDAAPITEPTPHVRKFFDCSTIHLTKGTHLLLENSRIETWPVAGGRLATGWFVYAHEEDSEGNIPDDLMVVINAARRQGCDYVLFDRDGPVIAELPVWEH